MRRFFDGCRRVYVGLNLIDKKGKFLLVLWLEAIKKEGIFCCYKYENVVKLYKNVRFALKVKKNSKTENRSKKEINRIKIGIENVFLLYYNV